MVEFHGGAVFREGFCVGELRVGHQLAGFADEPPAPVHHDGKQRGCAHGERAERDDSQDGEKFGCFHKLGLGCGFAAWNCLGPVYFAAKSSQAVSVRDFCR